MSIVVMVLGAFMAVVVSGVVLVAIFDWVSRWIDRY